jgi:hypothetical protein
VPEPLSAPLDGVSPAQLVSDDAAKEANDSIDPSEESAKSREQSGAKNFLMFSLRQGGTLMGHL